MGKDNVTMWRLSLLLLLLLLLLLSLLFCFLVPALGWYSNSSPVGLVYVVVNFLSQVIFIFPFVLTSLAYINIPKNKRKTKITWDKKLTTTYIFKRLYSLIVCLVKYNGHLCDMVLSFDLRCFDQSTPVGCAFLGNWYLQPRSRNS